MHVSLLAGVSGCHSMAGLHSYHITPVVQSKIARGQLSTVMVPFPATVMKRMIAALLLVNLRL